LLAFATRIAKPGGRGGKSVKTVRSAGDDFTRLRIGDHRVMCDILADDRVVLVAGIIHRRELETWLRKR
jgi:mRNA-degrading endonuclease RelE of RelBE toxin-antitoxin system